MPVVVVVNGSKRSPAEITPGVIGNRAGKEIQRSVDTPRARPHEERADVHLVRRKRRAGIALVAVLTVVALPGLPGIAQGAVDVNETIPLEGIVFEDICGEDLLHTKGNLHVMISFTVNDNHVSGNVHFQPQGTTLVGLSSGAVYVGTGVSHQSFSESLNNGVATFTSVDQFRLIGKGHVPTFVAYTVTENGKISSVDCCGPDEDVAWEETDLAMFNFAVWSWMMDTHPTVSDDIRPNLYDIPGLSPSLLGILATLPRCSLRWNTWPNLWLNPTCTRSTNDHLNSQHI